ncbi:hypothetical protein B0J14DRAFT_576611 [Halenospora varia]|nr:hypothetical protein B0J14DRAFT_576611 [Halenospora varia]
MSTPSTTPSHIPTGPSMTGTPRWLKIPAADVLACKNFYASLFPEWKFPPATEKYPEDKVAMWFFGEAGVVGGMIVKVPAEAKSTDLVNGQGVTLFHTVPNIEETKAKVESLGGKSLGEKGSDGNDGFFMEFLDNEGNRFGAYQVKA